MKHDSEQWRAERNQKMLDWVGDPHAVDYILDLGEVIEVWDDLIDQDKPATPDRINNTFYILAVKLPQNPFFVSYHNQLIPYLEAGYNAWLDSIELEKGNTQDKMFAYVLRFCLIEWILAVVKITRGRDTMRELSLEIRRFFTMYEPFEQYVEDLK